MQAFGPLDDLIRARTPFVEGIPQGLSLGRRYEGLFLMPPQDGCACDKEDGNDKKSNELFHGVHLTQRIGVGQ